jgi:uncharacterized protein YacL
MKSSSLRQDLVNLPVFPFIPQLDVFDGNWKTCYHEDTFFFHYFLIGSNLFSHLSGKELSMSADFIARIVGLFVFAFIGGYIGFWLGNLGEANVALYTVVLTLVGALFGLVVTPYFTTRPARGIRALMGRISPETLFSALLGLVSGLLIAALLAFPLSTLPDPLGNILPFIAVLVFGYFSVLVFVMRQTDIIGVLRSIFGRHSGDLTQPGSYQPAKTILLDTSVIIDGRIADIAHTGFLPGSLLIPRFVLNELQYIADSPDSMRRQRGRRGMEVLSNLQKEPNISVRISDIDVEGMREVDDKLVVLARQLKCPILTNDYNLNRVAELQGVNILNINELANAVKSVVLPGELMSIQIIQEGKEANQGVGYMDDGTMVVVENGNKYLNQTRTVTVSKVLQTAAGRMIFAKPEE